MKTTNILHKFSSMKVYINYLAKNDNKIFLIVSKSSKVPKEKIFCAKKKKVKIWDVDVDNIVLSKFF